VVAKQAHSRVQVATAMPTLTSITILAISVPLSTLRHPTTSVLSMTTKDVFATLLVQEKLIVLRTMILNRKPKQTQNRNLKLRRKQSRNPKLRLTPTPILTLTQLVFPTPQRNSRTSGRSPITTQTSLLEPCTRWIAPWTTSRISWLKCTPSSRLKA